MTQDNLSPLSRRLVKGALGTLGLRIFQAGTAFLISILLARILGAEDVGEYASVIATCTLLLIPVEAGLGRQAARASALLEVQKDWSLLKGLALWSHGMVLVYLSILFGGGFLFLSFMSEEPDFFSAGSMGLLIIICLGSGILSVSSALLKGLRRVVSSQLYLSLRNLVILLGLGTVALVALDVDLQMALSLYASGTLLALFASTFLLFRFFPTQALRANAVSQARTWMKAGLPFLMIGGLMTISIKSDVLFVRVLADATQAGQFHIANQIAGLMLFGLSAITMTVSPYFTRLHAQGDQRRLQSLATRSSQAGLAFAAVFACVIFLAGDEALSWLFGSGFEASFPILVWLVIANLIQASTGAAGALLTMTGNEGSTLRAWLIAFCVKVSTALALIPFLGGLGAGISVAASYLALNIAFWRAAQRHLGIETLPVSTSGSRGAN